MDQLLEKCLSCRYARGKMRAFYTIMEGKENDPDAFQDALDELTDFLGIKQASEKEKLKIIRTVFDQPITHYQDSLPQQKDCVSNVTSILYELGPFFPNSGCDPFSYHKSTSNIMSRICLMQGKKEEGKQVAQFKNLDEKVSDDFFLSEEKSLDQIAEAKEISSDEAQKVEQIYANILENFIYTEEEKWEVTEEYECIRHTLKTIIDFQNQRNAEREKYDNFVERYNMLNDYQREIVGRFVMKLPTHFGHNLERIMQVKGITDTIITNLIKPLQPKAKPTDIRELKNRQHIVEYEDFIRLLCRVLLVDREALYTGTGKSYGNWMQYLSDANAAKEGLKKLTGECNTEGKSAAKIKTAFRDALAELLSQDLEVEQLIQEQTENFDFTEEEFSVFKDIDEDSVEDEYEDPAEHYHYILDTAPIDILLDVLAEMKE